MATQAISSLDDIIDSRDVIERIEELSADRASLDADERDELFALEALQVEAAGYCADWEHGAVLIRDSYFATYAEELAEDIGAINCSATWPNYCIDWDRAARELQYDYTCIEFDGVQYWVS